MMVNVPAIDGGPDADGAVLRGAEPVAKNPIQVKV